VTYYVADNANREIQLIFDRGAAMNNCIIPLVAFRD
jgi:hypothetical protein